MATRQITSTGALVNDGEPKAKPKDPVMQVKVYSPYKIYFDDTAISLSGDNETGPFDILPHHHNFMTLLDACELVIRMPAPRTEERIKIARGVMHVKADSVTVFLDV